MLKAKRGGGGEGEVKANIKGDSLGSHTGNKTFKNLRSKKKGILKASRNLSTPQPIVWLERIRKGRGCRRQTWENFILWLLWYR